MNLLVNSAPDSFNGEEWMRWHRENWIVCFPITAMYLIVIYGTQYYMSKRKPIKVTQILVFWNSALAIFSCLGSMVLLHDCYLVISKYGLSDALCDNSFVHNKQKLFWGCLFAWSKSVELGDTLFVVLRRKPLRFLHVYHHAVTFIACFYYLGQGAAIGRWVALINFIVHSFMYTYFALVGLGIRIPRPFTMLLTTAQIIQMFFFVTVNSFHTVQLMKGKPCQSSVRLASISSAICLSYAILFTQMFFVKYFDKKPLKTE